MNNLSKEFDLEDLKSAVFEYVKIEFDKARRSPTYHQRRIEFAAAAALTVTKNQFTDNGETRVEYANFGTFKLKVKKGRVRKNPATGEVKHDNAGNPEKTPNIYTIKFKPAPEFLRQLEEKLGRPE